MKKILFGSFVLLFFSMAILIFQISCQRHIEAQPGSNQYVLPPATTSTLGGVIVGHGLTIASNGTLSINESIPQVSSIIFFSRTNSEDTLGDEIWKANIDGSNVQKLDIVLPDGFLMNLNQDTPGTNGSEIVVTAERKIIFRAWSNIHFVSSLFSCDFDGKNVVKLIDKVGSSYAVY